MVDGRGEPRQQRAQQAEAARTAAADTPAFERQSLGQGATPPSPPATGRSGSPRRSGLLAAAVAVGVAAAMATAWFMAPVPAVGDTGLDAAAQSARRDAFLSRGTVTFPEVPEAERAQAIASMGMPAEQQAALARDLARDDNALVYVTLWDDYAEDGDVVALDSNGFTRTVALTNAPQRFAVPVRAGKITLHGIQDGGGGITLGAQADGGAMLAPVMQPGQSIDLPVALP